MEVVIGSEKIVISDEFIEDLISAYRTIYEEIKGIVKNVANALQEILEQSHQHCYAEDNIEYYYDKNKGCTCRKITYKCLCGKRYCDVCECYEPPPKEKNKDKVLQKNKKKHSNHK